MTTMLKRPPAAGAVPAEDEVARPMSVTAGAVLAAVLSALAAVCSVAAGVAISVVRYTHDHTRVNNPAPIYAFELLLLLLLTVVAVYAVRSALRTLRCSIGRAVTVGLGTAAGVVALVVTIAGLAAGDWLVGGVALLWLVLTAVSLALLSGRTAIQWIETRSPYAAVGRWIRGNLVAFFGLLVMLYLYIPNVVVAAMSFNQAQGKRTVYAWHSFTGANWTHVCQPDGLCGSVVTSLWIGLVATIGATILGTLAAFALVRYGFVGRSTSNIVLFLPMATPEIVMGSSLLAFFVAARQGGHLGHTTIIIAHVMFCLSYVVMIVKARLAGMDSTLEQAAADLYATPSQAFWRVTFPLVFPGILAASLLSFSLSFDDYIVTNLNAGTTTTFPMYVWGAAQRGLPMQVNVIGTFMFILAVVVVLVADLIGRTKARSKAA